MQVEPPLFQSGVTRWNAAALQSLSPAELASFTFALNPMAALSAEAQGLKTPITGADQLLRAPEQALYTLCNEVGRKVLYLSDGTSPLTPSEHLCLLDFYTHSSCQRQGVGERLFTAMLKGEGAQPEAMAYDRPSPKLGPFLQKHYGLQGGIQQANRFMVFPQYFSNG